MYEFLQIVALSLSFLGMIPEFYHNYKNQDTSHWGQLPLFCLWLTSVVSSSIYITFNNIDILVSLNVYANAIFYTIVIGQKIYNLTIVMPYKKNNIIINDVV